MLVVTKISLISCIAWVQLDYPDYYYGGWLGPLSAIPTSTLFPLWTLSIFTLAAVQLWTTNIEAS